MNNNIQNIKWRKLRGEAIDIPTKDKVLQTILAEKALGTDGVFHFLFLNSHLSYLYSF